MVNNEHSFIGAHTNTDSGIKEIEDLITRTMEGQFMDFMWSSFFSPFPSDRISLSPFFNPCMVVLRPAENGLKLKLQANQ